MSIQAEQSPYRITDMWQWLTRMINAVCRLPSPPFYIGAILHVIMKVCGPKLMETYRDKYLKLVIFIHTNIWPKLEQDVFKSRLEEYLTTFINSKGTNSIKLITSS